MNKIAGFFDALADRWDELCYHDPEKITYILEHTTLHKGLKILDVGCGTGILEQYLLTYSPTHITGIDISPRMIDQASSKYAVNTVDFRSMDIMDLKDERFDFIIAYSVFPHFEQPEKLIAHLAELLTPGGELVICHSEGRESINSHHNKQANRISFGLPPVREVAAMMEPFFHIQEMEDTDNLYLVSGIRNR
ncbi:class I SAM-dependent methyltransferase [uncultured Parabacteroides sp.]|jgi:2-polyprenyl-3-methyl-5-hydroxy-6-metoxy-1,4-benzoquinol methylase|uniref:class I SAM-dependent methyltransferase n=1 Tax=uncultured Parabacteroides sp. TaxID=512312 RepID=UPI0025E3874C|nr:class I SAM-dependent methyltransferase [uncultured Parabacteroides sp.]